MTTDEDGDIKRDKNIYDANLINDDLIAVTTFLMEAATAVSNARTHLGMGYRDTAAAYLRSVDDKVCIGRSKLSDTRGRIDALLKQLGV